MTTKTWCMRDQFCIKVLNHHCCARVMEIMWGIPLPLDCWPNQHPNIYHIQSFYMLWAKIPTHHEPWPGMRIFVLALGRKPKRSSRSKIERKPKRKDSRSKIGRKQRKKKKIPDQRSEEKEKIIRKGLRTKQYLNNTKLHKQTRKERKPWLEVVLFLWLPTKILCAGDFLAPH